MRPLCCGSLLVALALAGQVQAQPGPADAPPLDFVPQSIEDLPGPQLLPSAPATAPMGTPARTQLYVPQPAGGSMAGPPPAPATSPYAQRGRYVWYGGYWWYFQPTQRWSYWSEGRWVDYVPAGRSTTLQPLPPPPPPLAARRRLRTATASPYYRYPAPPSPPLPVEGPPSPTSYR